jgi:hypothetical protein
MARSSWAADGAGGKASLSAGATVQTTGVTTQASADSSGPATPRDEAHAATGDDFDAMRNRQRLENEADLSSLRRGTGWIFGIQAPISGLLSLTTGGGAVGIGGGGDITLRNSISSVSTLVAELGYTQFSFLTIGDSFQGRASNLSTLGIQRLTGTNVYLGYEYRVHLDRRVTNALLLGAGIGYNHLKDTQQGGVVGVLLPRLTFGYRHVFGRSLGLEFTAEGAMGPAFPIGEGGGVSTTNAGMALRVGGHIGLVLAF